MHCVIARRTLVLSTSIGQSPRNISTNRNKPSSKTTRHGISSEHLNKGGLHAAHQPVIGPGERRKAEEVYEKPRTCEHLRAKTAPQQTTEYPWSMTCSGTRTSYRKFQKKITIETPSPKCNIKPLVLQGSSVRTERKFEDFAIRKSYVFICFLNIAFPNH